MDTNSIPILTQIGNAMPSAIQLHWPAIAILITYITHVNWTTVQNYCDARTGGVIPWLFRRVVGTPATQPAAPAAQMRPVTSPEGTVKPIIQPAAIVPQPATTDPFGHVTNDPLGYHTIT
jgi:hypothetical protein